MIILRGNLVMLDGEIVGEKSDGRFLACMTFAAGVFAQLQQCPVLLPNYFLAIVAADE